VAGTRPPFARELKGELKQELEAQQPGQPTPAIEWWFQDEARIGQQGTLTSVWAERGSRPEVVKQTEYQWVYLYAAVNPATGASSAMLAPTVNTAYMNQHLRFISRQVAPGSHAILVLDRAGWHVAKDLQVPDNITLLHLPPYSPKLNPVERVWGYMRSHYLGNRVFTDYDELFAVARDAWNKLDEARLKSICHTAWIERAI
jgi:transposase